MNIVQVHILGKRIPIVQYLGLSLKVDKAVRA